MNCLLEFRKMTFTIHFFFTFLTGIIFRPLFDEITIHGNVKITFFMKSTWYRTWCLMNFFSSLHFSRIHCNFMLITFLNGLPDSKHVSSQDVCLIYSSSSPFLASTATLCSFLFSMVYDILHNFTFHLLSNIFNILHIFQRSSWHIRPYGPIFHLWEAKEPQWPACSNGPGQKTEKP